MLAAVNNAISLLLAKTGVVGVVIMVEPTKNAEGGIASNLGRNNLKIYKKKEFLIGGWQQRNMVTEKLH